MNIPIPRVSIAPLVFLIALPLFATGCRTNEKPAKGSELPKVKVAYIGLTCEAPIFVAYEKGFYKEEGLDAELIKTDWDGLREGLGLGRFDANHTLLMYVLKPIEQGVDLKITAGIHTGCLRLHVASQSPIKSVKDLRGKKIGVPTHLGSPPFMFACRVLMAEGIDPSVEKKEVTWRVYPPEALGKAIENGLVDAIATSDPVGTILQGMGLVRTLADQADDLPYSDEYCCVSVLNGTFAREKAALAAKATRALLKGARWVEANPTAAAHLSVEKKYIAASVEINAQAFAKLRYVPGVAKCRTNIEQVAKEMVRCGLLSRNTDPLKLTLRVWNELEGVSDEWIQSLKVETVRGGGRPELLTPPAFALLCRGQALGAGCCGVE